MNAAGWGDNVTGQLAGGYRGAKQAVPVASAAFGQVDAVAAAYGCAYAVRAGQAFACGENIYGQYGDGTRTTARTNPAPIPLTQPVRQFAPAGAHWLALLEDGSRATCGGNSYGTLGNGTSGEGLEHGGSDVPVYLIGQAEAEAVASGGGNCASLLLDGTVELWGENRRGECGDGTKAEKRVPTHVPNLGSVKAIALGGVGGLGGHALALLDNGTVVAWGSNNHGQIGDGTTVNRTGPVPVVGLPGTVIAVASAASHSLALLADGRVFGWGSNGVGMLGKEPLTQAVVRPTEIPLPGPATIIAAGFRYSVFVIGGQVYTCGWNDHATLGTAAMPPPEYRIAPGQVPSLNGVESVSASDFEVLVGLSGSGPPPPIATQVVSGGIRVFWQPGMAKKLVWRPVAAGHQEWEGHVDVSTASAYTVDLPTGQQYEIGVTGGLLGQLVVEGAAL